MCNLSKWVRLVIKKWFWLAGFVPSIVDMILAFIPRDLIPSSIVHYNEYGIASRWALPCFFAGTLISAYLVHQDMQSVYEEKRQLQQARIAELEALEANISLNVVEYEFQPSRFERNGLPTDIALWSRIEVTNVGWEPGKFKWELDKTNTEIPPIFTLVDECAHGNFSCLTKISPQYQASHDFTQCFTISSAYQDPQVFVRAISSFDNYHLVLRYWTKRITGLSEPKTLSISGDFQEFRNTILRYYQSQSKFEYLEKLLVD